MRILTAFGCASLVALSLAATSRPSPATVIYPWCADYGGRMGGQNCGFTSLPQCLATNGAMAARVTRTPGISLIRRPRATRRHSAAELDAADHQIVAVDHLGATFEAEDQQDVAR